MLLTLPFFVSMSDTAGATTRAAARAKAGKTARGKAGSKWYSERYSWSSNQRYCFGFRL